MLDDRLALATRRCIPLIGATHQKPTARLGSTPRTTSQMRTLRAAMELFAEYGVGATSYQMIADAVEVTKGAIYHQFKTKDEIILAVAEMDGDAVLTGRPPELEVSLEAAEFIGPYTASRVTPLPLALLHSSCPVTAEVYSATGGYFTRFVLSHTEGTLLGVEPTVDHVFAHFDEIRGEGTVTNELDGEALVWGLQSFAPRLKPLLALQNRS